MKKQLWVNMALEHEGWHVPLDHCTSRRSSNRIREIWAWCIDYVDNALIEHAWRRRKGINENMRYDDLEHPLWEIGGPMGAPVSLAEFKQMLTRGPIDIRKQGMRVSPIDFTTYGRSADSIYKEICDFLTEKGFMIKLDEELDYPWLVYSGHPINDMNKEELRKAIAKAMMASKSMNGTVPSWIEDQLGELFDPQTTLDDYLDQAIKGTKASKGRNLSYTNYRRRLISQGLYLPTYYGYRPSGLFLLDTSGSMSQHDMSFGISELKIFEDRADIYVVPGDAKPYWECISRVSKADDIAKVKVVGRGGTVVDEFFRDYKRMLNARYGPFDFVGVITDGGLIAPPAELAPRCNTVWVLTEDRFRFMPNFGKVLYLRRYDKEHQRDEAA
jgi:predicted metal-dependent peptidase